MKQVIAGPMARPSRPSVRLTAFAAPTMMKVDRSTYPHPRSGRTVLKKGIVTLELNPGLMIEDDADEQRDRDLRGQPDLSRHAPAVLLGELPVVVEKADEAVSDHDHDDEPDVADGQVGPEERGDRHGEDDQDAAHRRRPFLGKVGIRPVLPDGLADLELLELADQPGADDEADDERRDRRIDRPEGDVAKDVEERVCRMKRI